MIFQTLLQNVFGVAQKKIQVLQSSYDMYHKPKNDMVDYLSALGLRHVGYGVPIELFGPFTDSCVQVMKLGVVNILGWGDFLIGMKTWMIFIGEFIGGFF